MRNLSSKFQEYKWKAGLMIRVYEPYVSKLQKKYVNEALDENMLTFHGRFTKLFEESIAKKFNVKHCITTTSGTTALYTVYQVAKKYLCPSYFKNDYNKAPIAITSSMTYAATASQLVLAGYDLKFVNFDDNLQINLELLDKVILYLEQVEHRSVSLLVIPSVYGGMPDMKKVVELCAKHRIVLIEDSAESFGCVQNKKYSGVFGLAGVYSFFANKIVTCGEGGAIVTNDENFAYECRQFINQGVLKGYYHESIGSNFRITNIQAAIGFAQMEEYDKIVYDKQLIDGFYKDNLDEKYGRVEKNCESTCWMSPFKGPEGFVYEDFAKYMNDKGIEVRPIFRPLPRMAAFWGRCTQMFPKSTKDIDKNYFILPSSPFQPVSQLKKIVAAVNNYV